MRQPEYEFLSTDEAAVVDRLIADFEEKTKVTVAPGSEERLFIAWLANAFLFQRGEYNHAINRNLPSRAEGADLDALGELYYDAARPQAKAAACTARFSISAAQLSAVLIPAGTRVTDSSNTLTWATQADVFVPIGQTWVDAKVVCQTPGAAGNGYKAGQINVLVDLYDYCAGAANTTESAGGDDAADDERFYNAMRESLDAISAGGARGSYVYWAKSVSSEIADVAVNSPEAGMIAIYVLMQDGTGAGRELKEKVLAACDMDTRRPMTDYVTVRDPETVSYDIAFTYYIPSDTDKSTADIQAAVDAAVEKYKAWQSGKLGRDINPDKLRAFLDGTGIKRIALTSPAFTVLADGRQPTTEGEAPKTPQVAKVGTVSVTNGGFEDE